MSREKDSKTSAAVSSGFSDAVYPPGHKVPLLHAPDALEPVLRADAQRTLRTIQRYLPLCYELCDLERAQSYCRLLVDYMDARLPLSDEERVQLIGVAGQLLSVETDLRRRARWYSPHHTLHRCEPWSSALSPLSPLQYIRHRMHTMARLLVPVDHNRPLPGLVMAWRPLYDLLVQVHFHRFAGASLILACICNDSLHFFFPLHHHQPTRQLPLFL
jgi:hypothetical protein